MHAPSPLLPLFRGVSGGIVTPLGSTQLHGSPARVATPMATPPPSTGSSVSGAIARSPLVERARRESADLSAEPSTLPAWAIGAIRMTQAAVVAGGGVTGVVRPGSADGGAAATAAGGDPAAMAAAAASSGVARPRSASFSLPGMAAAAAASMGADAGRTRLRSGSCISGALNRTGTGTPSQFEGAAGRPTSTPVRFADGGRASATCGSSAAARRCSRRHRCRSRRPRHSSSSARASVPLCCRRLTR